MDILQEDIKNTRFILTVIAVSALMVMGIAAVILIAMGTSIQESMLALYTTVLGALIGLVTVAYNSYFKDRQEAAMSQ